MAVISEFLPVRFDLREGEGFREDRTSQLSLAVLRSAMARRVAQPGAS